MRAGAGYIILGILVIAMIAIAISSATDKG